MQSYCCMTSGSGSRCRTPRAGEELARALSGIPFPAWHGQLAASGDRLTDPAPRSRCEAETRLRWMLFGRIYKCYQGRATDFPSIVAKREVDELEGLWHFLRR